MILTIPGGHATAQPQNEPTRPQNERTQQRSELAILEKEHAEPEMSLAPELDKARNQPFGSET
jgi:hypothetical protein